MVTVDPALRICFDRRVPMRDGVTLSADVYLPAAPTGGPERWPVVLLRTPYLKSSTAMLDVGRDFTKAGYVFVAMDVRGRGDSDGTFHAYFQEGPDGHDAVEWCAAQPWSTGDVGTLGGSYLGRVQWLAALEHPPHLRTMIVLVTPSDPFVETPTGVPSPMQLCWIHYTSGRVLQPMEAVNWTQVYEHLPLLTMDEALGRENTRWREDVRHAGRSAYWEPIYYQDKFDRLALPVLHISGWYDDEQIGTPLNYIGMSTRAATPEARAAQRLLMGPWPHNINMTTKLGEVEFGPQALIDLRAEEIRWFDRWLKGEAPAEPVAPVRIFVMGANTWRDEQEWPLARTRWTPYYLHSGGHANSRFGDGTLSPDAPPGDRSPDSYRYDPARPVPFITEPTSAQIGGPDDYAAVERRDDVLVYVTPPLEADLEVTGPIRVELYAASSAPDTDFMAKLVDVWPTGFTQRLCDGMVRARFRDGLDRPSPIAPGEIYHYTVDCWNTAQVFRAGHRVGLEIASSAFPKYDRHPNTDAPLGQSAGLAVATQQIYHDAAHPSALILPVIPAPDLPMPDARMRADPSESQVGS